MTDAPASSGKIICLIDNAEVHSVQYHIKKNHAAEWTLERYQAEFPNAPLLSEFAKEKVRERMAAAVATNTTAEGAGELPRFRKEPLAQVFNLPPKACMNSTGVEPVMCRVMIRHDEESEKFVPDIDKDYVFDIEAVKNLLIGLETGMNIYCWGYHGSGKTTGLEQMCARKRLPFLRVQHTINTEESHILGQYIVKNGETIFNLGPLPQAMINGWVYCADEYDFAPPAVSAVYQPVLEGKPLVIKDAPLEHRVIKAHPDFRFVATGNTNGTGDETGLYQGTQIQNAANYSRFHITMEVQYLDSKTEILIIAGKTGAPKEAIQKIVEFANEVRKNFMKGAISSTVSPRELISATLLGIYRGSNWRKGLELAFTNRLSRTDKEVVDQFAQRIFGGAR